MPEVNQTPKAIRFGPFEFSVGTGELRKNGDRLRLAGQPIEVLTLLVATPGELVTREELKRRLWGEDTFTDFEKGLNAAVNRLRVYLGDSATDPKYIETVPGRGYRFIAPLDPDLSQIPPPKWSGRIKGIFASVGKEIVLRKSWVAALGLVALSLMLAITLSLPAIARYYNNRGVRVQRSGDLRAAIDNYQRAISLKSGYAEAHYNLADAYEDLPDFDKALSEYQKAIEADPTFYEAYNNLARLYIKQRKDYGAALGLLERALNLKPQEPSVQYSLYKNYGWASLEMQLFGQSEHYLKSAVALDQGRGAAHCLLAKALDAQGTRSSALTEWEACAAYSSQSDVEPKWRAQAEERLNHEALTR